MCACVAIIYTAYMYYLSTPLPPPHHLHPIPIVHHLPSPTHHHHPLPPPLFFISPRETIIAKVAPEHMHIPRIPTSSQSIAESIPTPLLKNGEGNLYVKGDERGGEGEGERD